MGIQGLLKQLRSISNKTHLKDLKGLKVAIDGHCWIHRGAFNNGRDLGQGLNSFQYISFFLSMIDLLRTNGIMEIVVVFDGMSLPAKSWVDKSRMMVRRRNLILAVVAETLGDNSMAQDYYRRSIEVTPEMVSRLSKALVEKGISTIIAPYEADAQLAFLSQLGYVDVVITEDSDSIVYGCRKVLFKLGRDGYGSLIDRNQLCYNRDLSFSNWTDDQFKLFCCLCGCDYLPNLKSIGPRTAHKIVAKFKTFARVADFLSSSPKFHCDATKEYLQQLQRAIMTFKHQTIFNFENTRLEPLSPLPTHYSGLMGDVRRGFPEDVSFLGPVLDILTGVAVVNGTLNPSTLKPFDHRSNPAADFHHRAKAVVMRMNTDEKVAMLRHPSDSTIDKYLDLLASKDYSDTQKIAFQDAVVGQTHRQVQTIDRQSVHNPQESRASSLRPTSNVEVIGIKRKNEDWGDVESAWTAPSVAKPRRIQVNDSSSAKMTSTVSECSYHSSKVSPGFMTMKRRSVSINRGPSVGGVMTSLPVSGSLFCPVSVAPKENKALESPIVIRSPQFNDLTDKPKIFSDKRQVKVKDDRPFFSYDCDIDVRPTVEGFPFFDQDKMSFEPVNRGKSAVRVAPFFEDNSI